MSDIIQLLPENVANQIAAGEVIQRPASVVKELVENALDSGATEIKIIIKDAGRTLIQVIDNGCGMSETDARLSFERHATSKIRKADDLFSIRTMGFRGEALASIASVAQVELKTTQSGAEIGTHIIIEGSEVIKQEQVRCPVGANFMVKNLFYNLPARRKFLKTNSAELKHILSEIQRIALINAHIAFEFINNDIQVCRWDEGTSLQRIVSVFGSKMQKKLIKIETNTSLVNISGYIGLLDSVKRSKGDQYFFVNNRYMRHPYLHKAVMQAYEHLIPADSHPPYFIHFELDPATIDINIHPTKTEIKFEEEAGIWPILVSSVRESLGKSNAIPSIDFDQADSVQFPLYDEQSPISAPKVDINPNFNPFKTQSTYSPVHTHSAREVKSYFDLLDENKEQHTTSKIIESAITESTLATNNTQTFFQFKGKYILTPSRSGMMLIDQHRAHFRILFERYMNEMQHQHKSSQKLLFPESLEVTPHERHLLNEYKDDFKYLGFDLVEDETATHFIVEGVPVDIEGNTIQILEAVLDSIQEEETNLRDDAQKSLAMSLARVAAIKAGSPLTNAEMSDLFDQLFACEVQVFTPDGKTIMTIIENEYIEQRFK